ncbi:hypothetical protein IV203_005204 [Nitzschia inconspicua]|uniref:L domain-like protein n=1 Tax=Nitzschia inconspicua TaxID=303405 RepID=A0A9K3PGQ1_9STRA|nr:hypothetical protein IV203_005204 [Nitzschia inconspicua]
MTLPSCWTFAPKSVIIDGSSPSVILEDPLEIDERSVIFSSGRKLYRSWSFILLLVATVFLFTVRFTSNLKSRRCRILPTARPSTYSPTTAVPSYAPSPRPSDQRLENVIQCASILSSKNIDSKSDASRWKAVEYFYSGGGRNIETNDCANKESFFSTMYSLIVVRESMNIANPTWNDDKKQVSDLLDVCTWKRLHCSSVGGLLSITKLSLNNADLNGTIPPEISGFLRLEAIVAFSNPKLNGNIPSEVGLLSNIKDMQLHFTNVSGTVPTSLGTLSSLSSLRLYDTRLEGVMPQEVCSLRDVGNLTVLEADCTLLQCNCCTKCKNLDGAVLEA